MLIKTTKVGLPNIKADFRPTIMGASTIPYSFPQKKFNLPLDDWGPWKYERTYDTEHCRCAASSTRRSMELYRLAGNPYAFTELDTPWSPAKDLSNTLIGARFYIHDGTGTAAPSNITVIKLRIGNSDLSNSVEIDLRPGDETPYKAGWWEITTGPSRTVTVYGGGCNWSAVEQIRIFIGFTDNTVTTSVTFDEIWFFDKLSTGRYVLVFDDGKTSVFDLGQYLAAKGIPASFAVIPNLVGTAGFMTLTQLKELQAMGHLIVNHGHRYLNPSTTTLAEFIDDIVEATDWMVNNGFGMGSRLFVNPGGTVWWSSKAEYLDTYVLGKYVDQVRLTSMINPITHWNTRKVFCSTYDLVADDGARRGASTALTRAKNDGAVAVCLFHNDATEDYTQSELESHFDDIETERVAGDIIPITLLDLLSL